MYDYDRSNFIAFLKDFPHQPRKSQKIVTAYSLDLETSNFNNVVLAGMGGSAISGELLWGYIQNELKIPLLVNRNYASPHFVDQHTLLIATSYSGDTEETLSCTREAISRGATVVGISSGGKLEHVCKENECPHIKVPQGFPPRQALGYLFFSILFFLEKIGLLAPREKDIHETESLLRDLFVRFTPQKSMGNNLANHIAQSVYHAIPLIYTGVDFLYGVPVRWRNQFNENSKAPAFSNILPELNHNEIMAWEGVPELNEYFRVIFLRDIIEESPTLRKRISITKEILKQKKVMFGEIYSEGNSRLARLFSLIYTGDWASYYLAMLNERDPLTIDSIDLFKKRLMGVAV